MHNLATETERKDFCFAQGLQNRNSGHMNEKKKSITSKNIKMGLAIAIGAGLGIVFGEAVFGSAAAGLANGAGIGLVLGTVNRLREN